MNLDFTRLPKAVLYETALLLSLEDLNNLCKTNKTLNNLLCDNDDFWQQKLYRDYPQTIGVFDKSYRGQFKTIYGRKYESLVSLDTFEEFLEEWEDEIQWGNIKFLVIDIEYLYNSKILNIMVYPKILDEYGEIDENKSDMIKEYISQYLMDELFNLQKIIKKKYKKSKEYYDMNKFPKKIPAKAILNYFDPLLLKQLDNNNILIAQVKERDAKKIYTIIDYNSQLHVDFSGDT